MNQYDFSTDFCHSSSRSRSSLLRNRYYKTYYHILLCSALLLLTYSANQSSFATHRICSSDGMRCWSRIPESREKRSDQGMYGWHGCTDIERERSRVRERVNTNQKLIHLVIYHRLDDYLIDGVLSMLWLLESGFHHSLGLEIICFMQCR